MGKLDKNKTSKRSGGWTGLFIIFIICFPILIEYGNYYITHGTAIFSFSSIVPKLISIFKNYISFYATALTITFTVYSFTVQQRRIEEDREKKEEERNSNREQQEKDREEKRIKERIKEIELRIKELEAKRDFYRPTFIVEQKDGSKYDEVTLLMRDENLYLENIRFYEDDWHPAEFKVNLKSGSMLVRKHKSIKSFYITGETQIGEQILFGYLNGGIKIHKYLKAGESALIPREGFNNYNQDKVEATWGTYNIVGESDKVLDQVFFYNTLVIREHLVFTYYQSVKLSLQAGSATEFFRNLFRGISEEYNNYSSNFDSVHDIVFNFLLEVLVNQTDFKVDTQKISFDYLHEKLINLNENVQEFSNIFTSDDFNLFAFTNLALKTLETIATEYYDEQKMIKECDNLLRIITQVFDNVEVSTESPLNNKLLMYKADLFNNLNWS